MTQNANISIFIFFVILYKNTHMRLLRFLFCGITQLRLRLLKHIEMIIIQWGKNGQKWSYNGHTFFSFISNMSLLVLQDIYIRTKQGYLNLKYTVYN